MNNSELNDLLRRARVPERTDEQWSELQTDTVRLVAANASRRTSTNERSAPTRVGGYWTRGRLATLGLSFATACFLCVLALNHWRAGRGEPRNEIAEAQKLFSELNAMFPNQMEAVVFDGSTPRLVLAEQTSQNKGTPLFVRLCGARGCQRAITFSGQRVVLNGESCEVLVDARGHVIVTGEHFAWSSAEAASSQRGYRIEATKLEEAL